MNDIAFTSEQHEIWAELYRRQEPNVRRHASALYLEGFDRLELPADAIPTLEFLNSRIVPASSWTVVRTDVRFTDADN